MVDRKGHRGLLAHLLITRKVQIMFLPTTMSIVRGNGVIG
jgi:hypothetical protein